LKALRTHSKTSRKEIESKYNLRRLMEEVNEVVESKKEVIKDKKGNIRYILKDSTGSYIL